MFDLQLIDALEGMRSLDSGSVRLILSDPPYGISRHEWDCFDDWPAFWVEARRVLVPGGVVVLFAAGSFLPRLLMTNPDGYRYDLVWVKDITTGHLNANSAPMRRHENILVFCDEPKKSLYLRHYELTPHPKPSMALPTRIGGSVIEHRRPSRQRIHPTEKPVAALRYLIEMYANPTELVLDPFAGSGSTLVAALQSGRNSIGFETHLPYHQAAQHRLRKEYLKMSKNTLPDLEDLVRMKSHPSIGEITEFDEMTGQEFMRLANAIPRSEWRWHTRDAEGFGGMFSVPVKYHVEDGRQCTIPRATERNHWTVVWYTDDEGQKWLRLTREERPAEPDALLLAPPADTTTTASSQWLNFETSGNKKGG